MTRTSRLDLVFLAALLVAGLTFLPRALGMVVPLVTHTLSEGASLWISALGKLLFLVVALVFAAVSTHRFERANPARPPWLLLTVGLAIYVLGQGTIVYHQLVLGDPIPFPSLADLFFLLSVALISASLLGFVVAFRRAGFMPGNRTGFALRIVLVTVVLATVAVRLLEPVYVAEAPPLERFLNLAYPISDLAMLVPTVLLLGMSLRFAGGQLARVWVGLLLGFVFLAGGDVAFAYLTAMGQQQLDPLVDFLFLGAYVLIARATVDQAELLTA